MNTVPVEDPRRDPFQLSNPAAMGRRAVLSGAFGLSVGVALAATASAAKHPAAGAKIYAYGHSYTMMPNPYVSWPRRDEYQLQLGRRIGSGQVIGRGRSATRFLDTISAIIAPTFSGGTSRKWHIGDKGIVLLHNMMNDVSALDGGDADYLNAYEKALRLALGVFGARSFIHADRASRTGGGWRVKGYHRVEGGRTWFTRTYADKISFMVGGGDSVHVSTLCTDPDLLAQGTLRAECNGVILGYFGRGPDSGRNACNRGTSYIDSVGGVTRNSWSAAGWRITGLNAAAGTTGKKTLTLRKVDKTLAPVWVQGVYLTSGNAPRVLVAKEPPRNPTAANQEAVEAFYRNESAYRALIDGVCNEYGAAHPVDLRPGWDNASMVSEWDPYRFHPNSLGMSCIATNFERAVNRYVTAGSPGLR